MYRRSIAALLVLLLAACLVSCGKKPDPETYSEGLEYRRMGEVSAVTGPGTCEEEQIRIPESAPDGTPVTEIAGYAFQGKDTLKGVELPSGITRIGAYAFKDCTALTTVTLPEGVTEIGMYAFAGCSSLKQIYLGSSLTKVGDGAFNACTALRYAYWRGTAEAWKKISVGSSNSALTMGGTLYYYSARRPTQSGYYWYYDSDGIVRLWQ